MSTLILSCSTGQGHNSCAQAIKEYYDAKGEMCALEDALDFISHTLERFISWGHATMYRHFRWLFKVAYGYSERHPSFLGSTSVVYQLLSLGVEHLKDYILQSGFDAVICTHPFASLMMTELQSRYHLPLAIGLVATDYTCNPGTKESVADVHFIPDGSLSVDFECPNIEDDQICASGIPIRQKFYQRVDKSEAKRMFDIPEHHRHLVMMCGSMGCGPMKRLAWLMSFRLPEETDMTIVCGNNKRLEKKLRRHYAGNAQMHIRGYVDNMSALMDSADL